jgi:hypothetical protein
MIKPMARWSGHVEHRRENILMGKPEGKKPLGRSRRRREDNMKTDLSEIG